MKYLSFRRLRGGGNFGGGGGSNLRNFPWVATVNTVTLRDAPRPPNTSNSAAGVPLRRIFDARYT